MMVTKAVPDGLSIVRGHDSPDKCQQLLHNHNHPLSNWIWEEEPFREDHPYMSELLTNRELLSFQNLVICQETGDIVAAAYSIPFFCPQLAAILPQAHEAALFQTRLADWAYTTLPDGGWESILYRGIQQTLHRQGKESSFLQRWTESQVQEDKDGLTRLPQTPNAMSGLFVGTVEAYRGRGIADVLLANFKHVAREQSISALVVPVLPTRRTEHPSASFTEYISWSAGNPYRNDLAWLTGQGRLSRKPAQQGGPPLLPFDPWLRTHIRLGAELIKPALRSFERVMTETECRAWLKRQRAAAAAAAAGESDATDDDAMIDGLRGAMFENLMPVSWCVGNLCWNEKNQTITFSEGNVWLMHPLS